MGCLACTQFSYGMGSISRFPSITGGTDSGHRTNRKLPTLTDQTVRQRGSSQNLSHRVYSEFGLQNQTLAFTYMYMQGRILHSNTDHDHKVNILHDLKRLGGKVSEQHTHT